MFKKIILSIFLLILFFSGTYVWAQDYKFPELAAIEADYIVQCQFKDTDSPVFGAINNAYGQTARIVPSANAKAILGLISASDILGQDIYREKAQLAGDYLARIQDKDGAWFNQYCLSGPGSENSDDKLTLAKSPMQAAEVMIAFYKLGYNPERYKAMKKAALYLISCQKNGGDGNLLGGGKDSDGAYISLRRASDNSYAYQALKAAEVWALTQNDYLFALSCGSSSRRIIKGIDSVLYINNPYDSDYGVWYRVVDEKNQPVDPQNHDWINYVPQMLNLPCMGVGHPRVGKWIHDRFQDLSGACVIDDYSSFPFRKSPASSFQAVLCWRNLSQPEFYMPVLNWALESGLWQVDPREGGIAGGWIDGLGQETALQVDFQERFIDTSFYSIAAYNGGYDFSVVPAFLRIGYANPRAGEGVIPCYLKLKLEFPSEIE